MLSPGTLTATSALCVSGSHLHIPQQFNRQACTMKEYAYDSRMQQLTAEEKSLVQQLKQEVSDVVQKHAPLQVYCHDWTYVRYLTARRLSYKPHEVTWEDVAVEGATGKQFILAHLDKNGRPIVVMRPRNENTKDVQGQIRYLVYTLERASALADSQGVGKSTLLCDYEGYTIRTAPSIKTSLACLNIMQNHYPERLGNALCWHAPTYFSVTWKAVSPFVDPVTFKKVVFINKGASDEVTKMEEWLDMSQVEECMGGSAKDPAFQLEQYSVRMRAIDGEVRQLHAAPAAAAASSAAAVAATPAAQEGSLQEAKAEPGVAAEGSSASSIAVTAG